MDLYGCLVEQLGKYGKVLSPFVADKTVTDASVHEAVVAEVTQPSLGVGYEVGHAKALGKKILCLYRPQPDKLLSAMIRGAEEKGSFIARDYKEEDLPGILEEFFTGCFARTHKDSLDWTTYEPM